MSLIEKKHKRNESKFTKKQEPKKSSKLVYFLYLLLVLFIVFYAYTSDIFVGVATVILFAIVLAYEARTSIKSEGLRGTLIDLVVTAIVVIALWLILSLVMGTSMPLDAVASCSMLPTLQRGELVVVHGISNMSQFLDKNHIPIVNMSPSTFNSMYKNMYNESLAYYAYDPYNKSIISDMVHIGSSNYKIGLYNTKCLDTYAYLGENNMYYKCFTSVQTGPIRYSYMIGNASLSGEPYSIIETSSIKIGNTTIYENYSNPIVIYKTNSQDYFTGDIIHRVVAAINVSGTYYILTRGDNNQGLDIQFANYPPSQYNIVGYEVFGIPLVGYLKLLISGQLQSPAGCNQVIER